MKKKSTIKIYTIFCLLLSIFIVSETNQKKCVRGVKQFGFFAEFLWVLNHLEHCRANELTPVVYWGEDFAYYSKDGYNGSKNGWEYYFEPVSDLKYQVNDKLYTNDYFSGPNNFTTLSWYIQYIDNIHLLPKQEQRSFKAIKNHHEIYAS